MCVYSMYVHVTPSSPELTTPKFYAAVQQLYKLHGLHLPAKNVFTSFAK